MEGVSRLHIANKQFSLVTCSTHINIEPPNAIVKAVIVPYACEIVPKNPGIIQLQ
jgi:hypothetical protein